MSLLPTERLAASPENRVVGFGPVVVSIWRAAVTLAAAQRQTGAFEAHRKRHPRNGVLVLVEEGIPVPDQASRDELAHSMRLAPGETEGVAFCILGTGFGAATRRGVITGLQLLSRPGYPVKIFDTLPPACEWLLARGPKVPYSAGELAAAIDHVRTDR